MLQGEKIFHVQTNHQSVKIKVHGFYKMKDSLIVIIVATGQLGQTRMLDSAIQKEF